MAKGRKTGGRKAGMPNKATADARAAIGAFVEQQAPRLNALLAKIERKNGARAAFDAIMSVVEFHVPKLQRTDVNTNLNGKTQTLVRFEFVLPKEPSGPAV